MNTWTVHIKPHIQSYRNLYYGIPYWITIAGLIILFLNTGLSKISDHEVFKIQMNKQPLPYWSKPILVYALPIIELGTVGLLLFGRTRRGALAIATVLMLSYTTYAFLAYIEIYGSVICACGKIFQTMNWQDHFKFNLATTLLASFSFWASPYIQNNRKRNKEK